MTYKKDQKKLNKKDQEKIDSLKSIIEEAEKSLYSARAMLTRLEDKNKPAGAGVVKKTYGASPNGTVVEGVFDGQIMVGNDGKQYPVPANYASKSKLVEGDMLKLTITDDGNFVYKQIGPVDRKRMIGIIKEDDSGNYVIEAESKVYKVLLASVTYFKGQPGDEVAIVVPRDGEPIWCSIENVIKKAAFVDNESRATKGSDFFEEDIQDPFVNKNEDNILKEKKEKGGKGRKAKKPAVEKKIEASKDKEDVSGVVDEWTPKLSEIEKEAAEIEQNTQKMQLDGEDDNQGEVEEKVPLKINSVNRVKSIRDNFHNDGLVRKDFPDTPDEFFSK